MFYIIYGIFILLVTVLIVIMIYFGFAIRLQERKDKIIHEKKLKIQAIFDTLLDEDIKNIDQELKELQTCFKTEMGFKAFHDAYQDYSKNRNLKKDFRYLMNNIVDYRAIYENKNINETYRKSYVLFLISEFSLDTKNTRKLALDSLMDKSFYVRINALAVISSQKNPDLVISALDRINELKKNSTNGLSLIFLIIFKGIKLY